MFDAAEVESVFDAPLEMFHKVGLCSYLVFASRSTTFVYESYMIVCRHVQNEKLKRRQKWKVYKYLLHFFDHQAENKSYPMWALAAAAAVLMKSATIVYKRSPVFEVHMTKLCRL